MCPARVQWLVLVLIFMLLMASDIRQRDELHCIVEEQCFPHCRLVSARHSASRASFSRCCEGQREGFLGPGVASFVESKFAPSGLVGLCFGAAAFAADGGIVSAAGGGSAHVVVTRVHTQQHVVEVCNLSRVPLSIAAARALPRVRVSSPRLRPSVRSSLPSLVVSCFAHFPIIPAAVHPVSSLLCHRDMSKLRLLIAGGGTATERV